MRESPASLKEYPCKKRSDTGKIQNWVINFIFGTSMCQYLQTGSYVEDSFLKSFSISKDDHKQGYFIDCHLEYPLTTHEKTKFFSSVQRINNQNITNFNL